MTTPRQRLEKIGLTLPEAPAPVANYVPALQHGNTIQTSGQIPFQDGVLQCKGSVPSCQSIEQATEAARLCGLNALAVATQVLGGDINNIKRVLHLRVFISSDEGFEEHSTIANGVSDLMVAVFGEKGTHTRVAMGSSGLPLGATVEVEVLFECSK